MLLQMKRAVALPERHDVDEAEDREEEREQQSAVLERAQRLREEQAEEVRKISN